MIFELPVTTITTLLLFGTCTLMLLVLETRLYIKARQGDPGPAYAPVGGSGGSKATVASKIEALDIDSLPQIRSLLRHLTAFGFILLYSWVCEFTPLYPHAKKVADRDEFWFLFAIFIAFCFTKIEKNKDTAILNRDQTEEWKGWMQYLFLAYHYFHFSDVYNAVRIFISCYVWMTGFGNFSFFYTKDDFSFVRLWNMMWRLNFLVFFLCLAHNNTYILYYICPLHTFYFLMVYVVMRIGRGINRTKWQIRLKLSVLAAIIFIVWEIPGVYDWAFFFLGTTPTIGAGKGARHEFHFRTSLDHWSTFFGMIFALNFPMYTQWLKKLEADDKTITESTSNDIREDDLESLGNVQEAGERRGAEKKSGSFFKSGGLVKLLLLVPVMCAAYIWTVTIFPKKKLYYNEDHPYFFMIPLLAYIYARNYNKTLRNYHLHYLAEMGKITLETYLMQHHIWLTSNAKTLLVLIPNWPKCNMFLTTLIYVFIAKSLYRITINLRAMLIPDTTRGSLIYLTYMTGVLGSFYLFAVMTKAMQAGVGLSMTIMAMCAGLSVFAHKVKGNHKGKLFSAALTITVLAGVLYLCTEYARAGDYLYTHEAPSPTPIGVSKPPAPKKAGPDGVAQDTSLGLMVLALAAFSLYTVDNFAGLSWVALYLPEVLCNQKPGRKVAFSWTAAYDDMNSKIESKIKAERPAPVSTSTQTDTNNDGN